MINLRMATARTARRSSTELSDWPRTAQRLPIFAMALTFGLILMTLVTGCGAGDPSPTSEDGGGRDAGAEGTADRGTGDGPPNLLLITVDTLRADRIGAYGHGPAATPAMDRLAAEGTRMDQALSHVPMTLPSHASMMTGRLPIHTGVRNNGTYVLAEDELTLAEQLSNRGYVTGAALSAFVLLKKFGLAQGFSTYDDSLAQDEILRALDTEIPADRVLAKWRQWLKQHPPGSKPFFYWAHFYDPHLPYAPPEPYRSELDDPYDGEVAFVDAQIGEMLVDLEQLGLLDSTLIVLTSDHGEAFGEHGEQGHGLTAYHHVLRVPLILAGPGVEAGSVVGSRVGLVDLKPTLLDLLGLASEPVSMDGTSFVSLIDGQTEDAARRVYFETLLGQEDRNWAPLTGLYSGDRKLISVPHPELYDLEHDPREERNLVSAERRTYHRLDQELRDLLLGAAGPSGGGGRRELSDEDAQKLESLGYVSSGGRGKGAPLDPKDGLVLDARLREIDEMITAGRVDDAESALIELQRKYADQVLPSFFLFEHRIAAHRQQIDQAIEALARGGEALPEVYPLRYELAKFLIEQQRMEEAAVASRELAESYPSLSQAWILLGRSLESSDPDGAAQAYRRARRLEPDNLALAERMVDFFAHRRDLENALLILDQLVSRGLYDDRPEGLFKTAMLHMQKGNTGEAERLFALGLSRQGNGFFELSYALVLDRNGKRQEAVAAVTRALESGDLNPQQEQLARNTLAGWTASNRTGNG